MKLKVSPCLLLTILQSDPATAFTTPSHTAAIQTFLSNSYNHHDSQESYYEDVYYYHEHFIEDEPHVDFSRRDASGAFFRGLTAAGAVGAASSLIRPHWARAAEFSDGNFGPTTSAFSPSDAASVPSSSTQQIVEAASTSVNKASMQYRNSLAEMDPNILAAGAVATVGFFGVAGAMQRDPQEDYTTAPPSATTDTPPAKPVAEKPKWYEPPTPYGILNKNQNPFAEKAATPIIPKVTPGAPPAGPYGLAAGRNYWDGKDLKTAAELPKPPPPQPAPPAAPIAAQATNNKETRKWYEPPTPYGILNKDKNPFLKDIQQYCEPGKVSEPCTESIKGYLSDLSASGATASGEAAGTIVGYLDSLGGAKSSSSNAAVGNAAFTNYLDALSGTAASPSPAEAVIDALSNGSTPPPASAQAVKDYLDSLNVAKKPTVTGMVMTPPKRMPPPSPSASFASSSESYSAYDNRLTNIENRVSTLENRVNDLPDEVYNRMEEWRISQERKFNGEVDRMVGMTNNKINGAPVNGGSPVPPSQPPPPVSMGKRGRGMGGYLESLNP